MTWISKNMYIDKLDDIVNKYNNTYRSTINMKFVDVNSSTYIDFDKENNKEYPKFKIGDDVRIWNYKTFFANAHVSNWSEDVFVIKNVKNTVPRTYVISDLNGGEIVATFYEKDLQKTNQKELKRNSIHEKM